MRGESCHDRAATAHGLRPEAPQRHLSCSETGAATEKVAQAQAFGKRAEEAVVRHLVASGASIVATNLRVGRLEIDIVAREGRTVLVVEVRARGPGAWTRGFGSLASQKRARIRRAAERLWQRRYRHDPSVDRIRIDAASVALTDGELRIEYVKAAF